MQLPIARNRRAQPVQDLSSRSGIVWLLRDACCESSGCHVHDQFTAQATARFSVLADSARHHTAHCIRGASASAQLAAGTSLPCGLVRSKRCFRKTDCTGIRSSCCRQSARAPKEDGRPWTCLLGLLSTGCRFPKTGRKTSRSAHGGELIVCAVPIVCTYAAPYSFLCQQQSLHSCTSDKRWRKLCQCLDSCLSPGQ